MQEPFYGKWRIIHMDEWDQEFVDAEVPGYITFFEDGGGEFQFGYVYGQMNCQYSEKNGNPQVEFTWEGNDEMDEASGRGKASIINGELAGHLFLHGGDNSAFKACFQENISG